MEFVIILAVIIGIFNGITIMNQTRSGARPSTPPSSSLVDFVFFNK